MLLTRKTAALKDPPSDTFNSLASSLNCSKVVVSPACMCRGEDTVGSERGTRNILEAIVERKKSVWIWSKCLCLWVRSEPVCCAGAPLHYTYAHSESSQRIINEGKRNGKKLRDKRSNRSVSTQWTGGNVGEEGQMRQNHYINKCSHTCTYVPHTIFMWMDSSFSSLICYQIIEQRWHLLRSTASWTKLVIDCMCVDTRRRGCACFYLYVYACAVCV